jgi:hypothetical protein
VRLITLVLHPAARWPSFFLFVVFGHSIALWTFDRRGSRFEADVASEAACLAGEVTAAIVGQPLDGDRQAIDRAEAMLDGSEHQITNVIAADTAGGGEETHGLAITAIDAVGCDPDALRNGDYPS